MTNWRQGYGLTLALVGLMVAASPLRGEDFYEGQLRSGKADMVAGRNSDALDSFRIARFGFLERPALLVETLSRIALLQKASNSPGLSSTLEQFLDVETRFGVYGSAALEPETRSAFEALLLKNVQGARLAAVPTLAPLVAQPAGKPDRKKKAAAVAAPVIPPADRRLESARNANRRGDFADAIRISSEVIDAGGVGADGFAVRAHARFGARDYRGALEDFNHVPEDLFTRDPQLIGDVLVSLVQLQQYDRADTVLARVPAAVRERTDVKQAMVRLASRKKG